MPGIQKKVVPIAVFGLVIAILVLYTSPVTQNLMYHNFADQRSMIGIPHALNVLSNLPFTLVGAWGLMLVCNRNSRFTGTNMMYLVFFTGIFFIGIGSAYYHWSPANSTLVWDRLPMTIAFMAFTAIVVSERYDQSLGYKLFPWLLIAGILSVFYWDAVDDLRPYILVQFGPMLVLPLIVWNYNGPGTRWLWLTIAFYAMAKVLEIADRQILDITEGLVSGHTLKHLAAAAGALAMLLKTHEAGKPDSD
jgi:hypothetical protein